MIVDRYGDRLGGNDHVIIRGTLLHLPPNGNFPTRNQELMVHLRLDGNYSVGQMPPLQQFYFYNAEHDSMALMCDPRILEKIPCKGV